MSDSVQLDRTAERQHYSLGHCCQLLEVDANRLRSLAQSAHVLPALRLDSVDYFTAGDYERIRQQLAAEQPPTV